VIDCFGKAKFASDDVIDCFGEAKFASGDVIDASGKRNSLPRRDRLLPASEMRFRDAIGRLAGGRTLPAVTTLQTV
jgi:hypothetical protein